MPDASILIYRDTTASNMSSRWCTKTVVVYDLFNHQCGVQNGFPNSKQVQMKLLAEDDDSDQ